MSESTPFLDARRSSDLNENTPTTPTSDYKVYDFGEKNDSDGPLSPRLESYTAPEFQTHKRSKIKLALLITLGLGVLVGISAWQAPDHVKDVVNAGQDKATEMWQKAQEMTGNLHWWWEDGEPPDDENAIEDTALLKEGKEAIDASHEVVEGGEALKYDAPTSLDRLENELVPPIEEAKTTRKAVQTPARVEVASTPPSETISSKTSRPERPEHPAQPTTDAQDAQQTPESTTSAKETTHIEGPHPINMMPNPKRLPKGGPNEKFLAYLPHSGYHNQRVELVNALTLAASLDRTLLLPPVWLGWPITTQPYRQLQATWEKQMQLNPAAFEAARLLKRQKPAKTLTAADCKSYAKECQSTYQNTFLSWGSLTDISLAETRVPLVDRFNMTEAWAKELAGVQSDDDVYLLEDLGKYYFHFHDRDGEETELITKLEDTNRYNYTVSIPRLIQAAKDKKIVFVGSMFGNGRMYLRERNNEENREFFEQSLAFANPLLDEPANTISQLMGGTSGYIGVHARVGDGAFFMNAERNMEETFTSLLETLGVPRRQFKTLLTNGKERMAKLQAEKNAASVESRRLSQVARKPSRSRSRSSRHGRRSEIHTFVAQKRQESEEEFMEDDAEEDSANSLYSEWSLIDEAYTSDDTRLFEEADTFDLRKSRRGLLRRQTQVLGPIRSREDMPLSPTLRCRGPLHTNRDLLLLNNPVYIATDSRIPLTEPSLSFFFANLPCAFILSDFDQPSKFNTGEQVWSLRTMAGAYNEIDNVNLGRLFLPFMEAMVAAKGAETFGTAGSTFSCVSSHLFARSCESVLLREFLDIARYSGFASGALHAAYHNEEYFPVEGHFDNRRE